MNNSEDWREILKKEGFLEKKRSRILLDSTIAAFLHQHNQQLTNIQKKSIQSIYDNEDALLLSNTASGKTEAAVIPVAAKLAEDRKKSLCVYIAPTKALLNDLYKRFESPLHTLNLNLGIRHGDKPLSSADESLSFLLTTPESLDILLANDYPILSKTKHIICDEIHQIFGSPRGQQLIFLIDRLEKKVDRPIQRIAISATVGDQEKLALWFRGKEKSVRVFNVVNNRPIDAELHWIGKDKSLKDVIIEVNAQKILIFVNSRRQCDDLFLELANLPPYLVLVHYSTIEKRSREYVEKQFKRSNFVICIATTTLELGIDIGSIDAVILYEPPQSVSSFLQRIGRGSRRKGKTWVIMTPKNRFELLRFCALTSLAAEGRIENYPSGDFFSVFIQQIFSSIGAKHHHRMHFSEIEELGKFLPWVQIEDINHILKRLVGQNYLVHESDWASYQMGSALEPLFNDFAIFSNISTGGNGIQIIHEGHLLARIPLPLGSIRLGSVFVFAGRFWEVTSINETVLRVRPAKPTNSAIRPAYSRGGGSLIHKLVSNRIKEILAGLIDISGFFFDETSKRQIKSLLRISNEKDVMNYIMVKTVGSEYCHYTFAGEVENIVLKFIFAGSGYNCQPLKMAKDLCLSSDRQLDFKVIPDDEDKFFELVKKNWHGLLPLINDSPFFGLLPKALKRKEVLSQFDFHDIFQNIIFLKNQEIIPWVEDL